MDKLSGDVNGLSKKINVNFIITQVKKEAERMTAYESLLDLLGMYEDD